MNNFLFTATKIVNLQQLQHFSLPLQPEIISCNAVKTTDARLRDTGRETIWPSPRVPKSRSPEVKKTMITQDQLKDVCKRIDALRRYL